MNKLRPRNKICFQNNQNIHSNMNIEKLTKKKWQIFKKKNFFLKRKNFFFKRLCKIRENFKKRRLENKHIFKNEKLKKSFLILLKEHNLYKRPKKKKNLYKERLIAKQQFKNFYGCIPEYQLKNLFYYLKNKSNNNNIIQKFIIFLESRLDMVIYRAQITKSIFQAKQIINHGKIKVNNKIITSSNFILNRGDIITLNNFKIIKNYNYIKLIKKSKYKLLKKNKLKNNIKKTSHLIKIIKKNKVNYIQTNNKYNFYIFLKKPSFTEINYPFKLNLKLIDEYFKKN